MTINERIKEIRRSSGLSQTDFAERLGTTRGVITNLSNLIGCRALYFNHNLRAEEDAGLPEDYLNYIREQIRKNVLAFMDSYEQIAVPGYQSGPPLLLYPLYSNIMYYGVIVVEGTRALTELDEAAILQTKMRCISCICIKQTYLSSGCG